MEQVTPVENQTQTFYINAFQDTTSAIHAFSSTVLFQWIESNAIARFTVKDSTRNSIDIYIDSSIALLKSWNPQKKLYTLHDISTPQFTMTPYTRTRLNEVSQTIKEGNVQTVSAIYMMASYQTALISFFGNIFTANARHTTQQYFINEAEALHWLKSKMIDAG